MFWYKNACIQQKIAINFQVSEMRVGTIGKRLFDSLLRISRKAGDAYAGVRLVVIRRHSSLHELLRRHSCLKVEP